jgi:hypothetical protein
VRVKLTSWLSIAAAVALLGGCDTATKRARSAASVTVEPPPVSAGWKAVATTSDEDRINRIGLAWQAALTEAQSKFAKELRSEAGLLKPRSALPRPQPTPGSYNCRMISIGKTDKKSPLLEKFKPFFCYVLSDDEGVLTIVKQTGSQRPAGRLWDDDMPDRMIFLGSLALGDEKEPLAYGDDPDRDMAGVFERIGPFKWRLVIPWPRSGAKLEVFELTPVADQPEG